MFCLSKTIGIIGIQYFNKLFLFSSFVLLFYTKILNIYICIIFISIINKMYIYCMFMDLGAGLFPGEYMKSGKKRG
jgi:hypothetical protein